MAITEAYDAGLAFSAGTGVYEHARFGRVITAMVSPFNSDGGLNLDGAQRLAEYLEANGSEGLVVAGSTGESSVLKPEEHLALLEAVSEAVSIPILAGTGSSNTQAAVELSGDVSNANTADGLLVVSPAYNRPPQSGIEDYYRRIADATDLPIVMYNIPIRTGRHITTETILRLAEIDNVVALKDATGDVAETSRLIAQMPEGFQVYSGEDALNLPLYTVGAIGAISVASHWGGRELAAMYDALESGDLATARELHQKLLPSYSFESSEATPNPIPTKVMMRLILGETVGYECRSPLVVPEDTIKSLQDQAIKIRDKLYGIFT